MSLFSDDVSEVITNGSCYTINNSSTIYAYRNNIRYSYSQIGGKWFETSQQNYTNLPVNNVCYTYSDIAGLHSFAVYEPFLYLTAFILAFCAVALFFKTIKGFLYGF